MLGMRSGGVRLAAASLLTIAAGCGQDQAEKIRPRLPAPTGSVPASYDGG
jgi:hypothetical protein